MKIIPVGPAIVHAYRFVFGQFPAMIRLSWLALLPAIAGNALLQPQLAAISRGFSSHDFSGVTMPWWLLAPLYVVVLIAGFMQITAMFQYALARPEASRHRWFYFSLGMPLWRMIGSLLLFALTLAALVVVYLLAMILVGFLFGLGFHAAHMSDSAIKTVTGLDTALALLAGYCALIFCATRFGFLLFAGTIALDRVALLQSWLISQRNFWRMFAISLAIFLPVLAVLMVAIFLLGAFPHIPPGATPDQVRALQNAASAALIARLQHYWYLYYPVSALITIVITGLAAGAQSFAWRALNDDVTSNPP